MESKKTTSRSQKGKRQGLRGLSRTRGLTPTVKGRPRTTTPKPVTNGSGLYTNFSEVMGALRLKHTIQQQKLLSDHKQSLDECSESSEIVVTFEEKQQAHKAIELTPQGHEDENPTFVAALRLLKGVVFKRDQPYRTRLPLQGNFASNSSGVVNSTISNASIGSVSEWASISALFDEFFVHSYTFRFHPYNNLGGGVGYSGSASITGGIATTADTQINNAAMLVCCLYNGAGSYTSASAMAANATVVVKNSSKPWSYTWRNNAKFEKHGLNLTTASNLGWQGWTNTSTPGDYGGGMQFRMLNDAVIGSASAAVNLASYIVFYDVSFRARS